MQPIFDVSKANKQKKVERQNQSRDTYVKQQVKKAAKKKRILGIQRRIGLGLVLVGALATYIKFGDVLPHEEVQATAQNEVVPVKEVDVPIQQEKPATDAATPVAKPATKPEAKQASTNSDPVPPPPGYANAITLDTPIANVKSVSPEAINRYLESKGVLKGLGETYYAAGTKSGIPAQLLAAMAVHETGKGTSYVARQFNNLGGMICNSRAGKRIYNGCSTQPGGRNVWQKYNTREESVFHKAQLLKSDYIRGNTTVRSIWHQYAPSEANNDPKGLNKGWGPGVTRYYNEIVAVQKQLDKEK